MGDANEGKRISSMENLSLQTNRNRNPRDFLQRFTASSPIQLAVTSTSKVEEEEDEIELNLGLSLGGRFGVDKTDKKLIRSSSIAGTFPIVRDDDDMAVRPPVSHPALVRTSSLPVETEEEWRKRKELQTLRRMEAKRRRSEKQRILRSEKDGGSGGSSEAAVAGSPVAAPPLCGLLNWVAARKSVPASDLLGGSGGSGRGEGVVVQSRSVDSQGGSSSGGSESAHGSSSFVEASPASIQSKQERSHQEAACSSGAKGKESASKSIAAEIESLSTRPENVEKRGKEMGLNSLEDMPCVFTQGDGPNGKRIEGILYKYGKGEEVRIMCVCHGRFLSPAEFVEHAGGTDVARPLRHIVVNPSSNSFL